MLGTFLKSAVSAAAGEIEFVGGSAIPVTGSKGEFTVSLTSLSGGLSSSAAAGDIVIACIAFDTLSDIDILCSGYTEVFDVISSRANFGVFYKVLSGADTEVVFDIGLNYGGAVCAVYVWRGVDASTPLDVTSQIVSTSGAPNPPSITTVTNGAVIVAIAGGYWDDPAELVIPSGMENGFVVQNGNENVIGIASYAQETAGIYNPNSFSIDADPVRVFAATMALRPA